jgi:hypothetical protein
MTVHSLSKIKADLVSEDVQASQSTSGHLIPEKREIEIAYYKEGVSAVGYKLCLGLVPMDSVVYLDRRSAFEAATSIKNDELIRLMGLVKTSEYCLSDAVDLLLDFKQNISCLEVFNEEKMSDNEICLADSVFVPEASSGHSKKVFTAMGCQMILDWCLSSSAGDWDFLVKREGTWHWASQVCEISGGFSYYIGDEIGDPMNCSIFDEMEHGVLEYIARFDPESMAEAIAFCTEEDL